MKMKIITVTVFTIVLSFLFYWCGYRPSHIRSICVDKISNKPSNAEELELQYKMCLRGYGLEK